MGFQREFHAFFLCAAILRFGNVRIERDRRRQGQSDHVVELQAQVGQLQLGAQQFLLGLKRLCTALDEIGVEGAAILDLLHPLALQFVRRVDFGLHGTVPHFRNQDLVVKLVHRQCDLVLDAMRLAASGVQFGARDIISRLDFPQLGKRLDQAGPAALESVSALIEHQRPRRNQIAADYAESSGGNVNKLGVGDVDQRAVIANHGKICAPGDVLGRLFFVDRRLRDANHVVVLQG